MPKRTSEELKDEVVNMTVAGHTQKEISEMLGMSAQTVRRIQRERNAAPLNQKGGYVSKSIVTLNKDRDMDDGESAFVMLSNKSIELIRMNTTFKYMTSLKGKDLKIDTGYGEPIILDIRDVANFANELMDVCILTEKMRKTMTV